MGYVLFSTIAVVSTMKNSSRVPNYTFNDYNLTIKNTRRIIIISHSRTMFPTLTLSLLIHKNYYELFCTP